MIVGGSIPCMSKLAAWPAITSNMASGSTDQALFIIFAISCGINVRNELDRDIQEVSFLQGKVIMIIVVYLGAYVFAIVWSVHLSFGRSDIYIRPSPFLSV